VGAGESKNASPRKTRTPTDQIRPFSAITGTQKRGRLIKRS
jgi:hypothetical protein